MGRMVHLFLIMAGLSVWSMADRDHYVPSLQKGEEKFAYDKRRYKWSDFNLGWDVRYFDVVRFSSLPAADDGSFELPQPPVVFETIFQAGRLPQSGLHQRDADYLARTVATSAYFWKHQVMLLLSYTIYSLRFIDAKDGKAKAVETRDEVRHFLGKIDTPAELSLWLLASESPHISAYSYMRTKEGYRVRFLDDDIFSCTYHEYFKYYDAEGKVVRVEPYKKIHYEKPCPEIAI